MNSTTCEVCEVGTYSLWENSIVCKDCIDHATCYGSYNISIDYGYWREDVNKEVAFKCYYMPACEGRYESECKLGYGGRLCHDCIYDEGTSL